MNIVYLVESATGIWGGVKVVFQQANLLQARGHQVTILSRTAAPDWFDLRCTFRTVPDFQPQHLPLDADVVVGTFWTTVPFAATAPSGVAVHLVQGFEGDNTASLPHRDRILAIYNDVRLSRITISPHLRDTLRQRFNQDSHLIRYLVDHDTMFPVGRQRLAGQPVRVGLVGPCDVDWKDIPTGLEACRLAHLAGLDLQLVRVTNTSPQPAEQDLPFPVEWHVQARPESMGDIYRSLDVFLGTSRGAEEGFFLPAVEAMACGVPTVLTDIPCFRGYGEGQYALFVAPRDPHSMAEALVIAAAHPQVQNELRRNGLQIASRYTPENHVAELEQAFITIAGSRSRHAAIETESRSGGGDIDRVVHHIVLALQAAADLAHGDGDRDRAARYLEAARLVAPRTPAPTHVPS